MRTKESEDFQEQEDTWIYLLHQQAPPQRRETSVAALAQVAGAQPSLPPATALLGGGSAFFPLHGGGPLVSRQRHLDSGFPSSADGPYLYKTPREPGVYGMKQQQTVLGAAPSSSRMMMFAHDKLQETWHGADAAAARQPSAFQLPPPAALADDPYRRKHHHYPAAELNGAFAALEKYEQLNAANNETVAPSSLLELLPKKRRRVDESKQSAAAIETEEAVHDFEDADATSASVSASTPRSSSRGKRNCFPKKCDFPMCKNSSRSRGFCYSHGGGRRCSVDGCSNGAVSRDLCKRHGGGRRCKVAGCKSSSESGGLCYSHGGGRRCSLAWCTARAKKGGLCALHLADQSADRPASAPKAGSSSQSTGSSSSGGDDDSALNPTTVGSSSSSSSRLSSATQDADGAGEEAVVHTNNVVETLLALSRDEQTRSDGESAPTSGYAIASILN